MKFTDTFLLFLALASNAFATPTPKKYNRQDFVVKTGYNRIFLDDFSRRTSSMLPNGRTWRYGFGAASHSWEGLGVEKTGSSSVRCTYPPTIYNLHLSEEFSLMMKPQNTFGKWTSGKIETSKSFKSRIQRKMLYEARIKIGDAQSGRMDGLVHRFYTVGAEEVDQRKEDQVGRTNWPRTGEVEILEIKNGKESMVPVLHCGEEREANGGTCHEPVGYKLQQTETEFVQWKVSRGQYHTFGFEVDRTMCWTLENDDCWRNETISWHMDGVPMYTMSGEKFGDKDAWGRLVHEPRTLGLIVSVGEPGVKVPSNSTVTGQLAGMEIDYVGVWETKTPTQIKPTAKDGMHTWK